MSGVLQRFCAALKESDKLARIGQDAVQCLAGDLPALQPKERSTPRDVVALQISQLAPARRAAGDGVLCRAAPPPLTDLQDNYIVLQNCALGLHKHLAELEAALQQAQAAMQQQPPPEPFDWSRCAAEVAQGGEDPTAGNSEGGEPEGGGTAGLQQPQPQAPPSRAPSPEDQLLMMAAAAAQARKEAAMLAAIAADVKPSNPPELLFSYNTLLKLRPYHDEGLWAGLLALGGSS